MNKYIKIKQKKQDNGLWGMPINCKSIDDVVFHNELLHSAIIIAFDEKYNKPFKISLTSHKGFFFEVFSDNLNTMYQIIYDNYEIDNNKLYFFNSKKEHNTYLRKKKLEYLYGQ